MPEVRVDPLTGLRTIVAGDRATRPGAGLTTTAPDPIDPGSDPFLEGHEDRTPPELYAVRDGTSPNGPGWKVRVVPNLYPALSPGHPSPEGMDRSEDSRAPGAEGDRSAADFFTTFAARGSHEVIVNGPQPVPSLADLPLDQVSIAIDVWRDRIRAHRDRAAYVHLLVNERREGGASLPHTHAQLYALPFVPAQVARERERFTAYATRTMGGNLLADLVGEEVRRRERIVAIDDEAVLMAPFGSRLPYQLMLAPRVPRARFEDDGPTGAALLHDGLRRIARLLGHSPPLNLWVRTQPQGAEHFCWRIDVMPRLTHLAGLELGVGVNLNVIAPEQAAAQLRDA